MHDVVVGVALMAIGLSGLAAGWVEGVIPFLFLVNIGFGSIPLFARFWQIQKQRGVSKKEK